MSSILITCEHAGNKVPEKYSPLFVGAEDVLNSHRGWDPGAFDAAAFIARNLSTPIFATHTTRLLIETNRSLDNPELFSEFTRGQDTVIKNSIVDEFYTPYRSEVERTIASSKKPVFHVSIHSFTPILNSVTREVEIGLLFDPARMHEVNFCKTLQKLLQSSLPRLKIKFNEPYRGTDDGFTTHLRKKFPEQDYCGIEIEINQKFVNTSELATIQMPLSEGIAFAATI